MPPKRATRASARPGSTPARRRQPREPSSDIGLSGPTVMASTTPNPAKYSTNYGSPATIMPVRRPGTYGTNLAGAFGSVLEKVRQDNADDEQARIQREAAEAGAGQESSPIVEESPLPENHSSEPDLPSGAGSSASRHQSSQSPAQPDLPAVPSNNDAGLNLVAGRRQTRSSIRAGSAQPVNTPSLRPGRSSRLQSEPVHSDAATVKSYLEESNVYNKADVNTPVAPSSAATQQQERTSSAEPTPSRRPIRNPPSSATSSVQNTPVPPHRRKLLDRIVERSSQLSDKIDEQPEKEAQAEATSLQTAIHPFLKPLPSLQPARRPPTATGAIYGQMGSPTKPSASPSSEEEDVDDINGKDPITTIRNSAGTRRPGRPSSNLFTTANGAGATRRTSRELTAESERRQAQQRLEDQREIEETRSRMQAAQAAMDRIDRAKRASESPMVDEAPDTRRPAPAQKPLSLAFNGERDQLTHRRQPRIPSPERESSVENDGGSPPRRRRSNSSGFGKAGRIPSLKTFLHWLGSLALLFLFTRFVVFYTQGPTIFAGTRVDSYKPDWSGNPFRALFMALPWSVLHPLGCLSDAEYSTWGNSMLQQHHLARAHGERLEAQRQELEKISKVLPNVVYMESGKDGKPQISHDFWYALRGLIHEDSMILTIENMKGREGISDQHWNAIKYRLETEKVSLPSDKQASNSTALSPLDVEHITERTMSRSWETWVKQNEDNLRSRLGDGIEERISARMDKALREKLRDQATNNVPVSRAEFMQILYDEVTKHGKKIQDDLQDGLASAEGRFNEAISNLRAAADDSHHPAGLTREQVKNLVDSAVRKVWGDAQLEAMAKGKISAHYQDELSTQINVFDLGNHATVDSTRTSRTYQLPKQLKDVSWWQRHRGPVVPRDAYAALMPWSGPGDCWCTATAMEGKKPAPADLAIMTGRRLIPQNLVVEHIDAGATIDPDAAPRLLEVWAHVADVSRRRTAEAWMFDVYPDTRKDHGLLLDRFVKVGEFVYDRGAGRGDAQVFQISRQLLDMDLQTDHVVVRAASNYGADHTCFYRLRLYGEIIEPAEGSGAR